jgi:CRP-like cAMP-binding protein
MESLLERLSPGQIIAVISILSGSVVALTLIVAITKFQFQALADATELQREKQQADLALRQSLVERAASAGEAVEALQKLDTAPPGPGGIMLNALKRACGG